MQQQHAQAFTYNVLVEIVPYAKLNQSQLFQHCGIYRIERLIAKSKQFNELERVREAFTE